MALAEKRMNLETLVNDVEFPATKIELTEVAIEQGASAAAITAFEALPKLTYENFIQLQNDFGAIEKQPGNENIWETYAD